MVARTEEVAVVRRITVVPYDANWPQRYEQAATRLREVLGPELVAVHHVGSTAVPGLVAKPIIDVLLAVRDLAALEAHDDAMRAAGYRPMGEQGLEGRRYYVRGSEEERLEHVHAWEVGHPRLADHLAFRDYLRARPEARLAYGRLKQVLAAKYPDDPAAYTTGKESFIREVLTLALAFAGEGAAGGAGQAQVSVVRLPTWVSEAVDSKACYATTEAMMALAVRLASENVTHGTGGPFGAAVFDVERGRLVAAGVNLVETAHASWAHAEMVALALAQQTVGTYDLSAAGLPRCALVTSAEPCAMCLGAMPWSGVRLLVCGARDEDVRAIGFDEGQKPADWVPALEQRGIAVLRDVLRDQAVAALRAYVTQGGSIYNPGRSKG